VSVPREFEVSGLPAGRYWVGEIRKGDYRKAALIDLKQYESQAAFTHTVHDRINNTKRRELMVFIHGYSTNWQTAVQRTAALAVALELDGAPVLFSWPSRGDFLSYVADGNELTSVAVEQLGSVLSELIQTSDADRIYVISHSMGARFLLSGLERIRTQAGPVLDSLIFASPDVDADDFAKRLPAVSKLASRTSLYVSENDQALRLSSWVNDARRAGDAKARLVLKGADTVNTTKSNRDLWTLDGVIGHNDFATGAMDDLRALVWHGLTASQRCILVGTPVPNGKIWALLPPQGCTPATFKMGIHASRRLGPSEASAFLSIQATETCRNAPGGQDCRAWRESKRVADAIAATGRR
jgi:esterase/lipase superfamily enzyme